MFLASWSLTCPDTATPHAPRPGPIRLHPCAAGGSSLSQRRRAKPRPAPPRHATPPSTFTYLKHAPCFLYSGVKYAINILAGDRDCEAARHGGVGQCRSLSIWVGWLAARSVGWPGVAFNPMPRPTPSRDVLREIKTQNFRLTHPNKSGRKIFFESVLLEIYSKTCFGVSRPK